MMWNGDGSWGWFAPGLIVMAICMFMMMRMMGHAHGSHGSQSHESHGRRSGGAERILAERLARGEIDTEEYQHRLTVLRGTTALDRPPEPHDVQ